MLRFTHYYGHSIWVEPTRVLYVEDGGCGSRGVVANVRLDNGETVTLNARAEDVQREISEAIQ